ncbi:hypothetical protein RB196_29990 [Streptomyces sp. PmtA]|uniref:hypothetical protein n=1 Tax=Streptomyces sp. PmtA TaxID=3074275 RepID=UPI003014386B
MAFGARDVLAATVTGSFAGHWLANSLVLAATPPGGSSVLGVLNVVFAVFAVLMATVMGPRRAVWLVLVAAVPRFVLSGAHETSGPAGSAPSRPGRRPRSSRSARPTR